MQQCWPRTVEREPEVVDLFEALMHELGVCIELRRQQVDTAAMDGHDRLGLIVSRAGAEQQLDDIMPVRRTGIGPHGHMQRRLTARLEIGVGAEFEQQRDRGRPFVQHFSRREQRCADVGAVFHRGGVYIGAVIDEQADHVGLAHCGCAKKRAWRLGQARLSRQHRSCGVDVTVVGRGDERADGFHKERLEPRPTRVAKFARNDELGIVELEVRSVLDIRRDALERGPVVVADGLQQRLCLLLEVLQA